MNYTKSEMDSHFVSDSKSKVYQKSYSGGYKMQTSPVLMTATPNIHPPPARASNNNSRSSRALLHCITTTFLTLLLALVNDLKLAAAEIPQHPAMECHAQDSDALLKFKAGFGADFSGLESWQDGSNCCWWYGITCRKTDPDYARVNFLELDGDGDENSAMFLARDPSTTNAQDFGASLGGLTELEQLILRRVYFNSPIPGMAWSKLFRLRHLELRHNNFTGGSIPEELGGLKVLRSIAFSGLRVPAQEMCYLVIALEAREVDLSNNNFSGNIPPCMSHWYFAHSLLLSSNHFTGFIPSSLGNLSNLRTLDLSGNHLSGSIPSHFAHLTHLQTLSLSSNQLTGAIPPELGLLPSLVNLELEFNQLVGGIPPSFGLLHNLETLMLSENELSGSLPVELGNLSRLQELALVKNQLTGSIPRQLGSLKDLRLDVSDNFITGEFPLALCNVIYVDMSNNLLTSLQQMDDNNVLHSNNVSSFQFLYLDGNKLQGQIPSWLLYGLNKLTFCSLSRNNFSGSIPLTPFLEHPSLVSLDLSYNKFEPSFLPIHEFEPPSGIDFLGLHHCGLRGPIPQLFFGNIPGIIHLDLSHNFLSGSIPATICDQLHLHELDLSYNDLSGLVPDCLNDLTSYAHLDLSHNNFTLP